MTQRVFDIDNEKDMQDLWNILPDDINKIESFGTYNRFYNSCSHETHDFIKINWHDKTEITRPIQEATEADIGKLCYFWTGKDYAIGILVNMYGDDDLSTYCMENGKDGIWFAHCRRLTKQEIEELC